MVQDVSREILEAQWPNLYALGFLVADKIVNGERATRDSIGVDLHDRKGGLHLAYNRLAQEYPDPLAVRYVLNQIAEEFRAERGVLHNTTHVFDHHLYKVFKHAAYGPYQLEGGARDVQVPEELLTTLHLLFPPPGLLENGNLEHRVQVYVEERVPSLNVRKRLQPIENSLRNYAKP